MKRIEKKLKRNADHEEAFGYWLMDLNGSLMETLTEETPMVETIVQQAKHRMRRMPHGNIYFQVTRMRQYVKLVMGQAYGKESRR